MRYLLYLTLFLLSGSLVYGASGDSCILTGHIRGFGHHRIIFSYYPTDSTYHADTLRAQHGDFVYRTQFTQPTYIYVNTLRDHPKKFNRHTGYSVTYLGRYGRRYGLYKDMLLENRRMTWTTAVGRSYHLSPVTNAPLNDTLMQIEAIPTRVFHSDTALKRWHRQHPLYASALSLIERDTLSMAMYRRQGDSIAAYIIAHPSSYASANALWRVIYSDRAVKEAAYHALDPSLRSLTNVVSYRTRLDRYTGHVSRGDIAPEISLADTAGRTVALSSYRGRVTLVDFWASWCGPCRRENPNVVAAYKKYHPRGLEIYAVSLDMVKDKWKAAIEKDKLPWTHVSDLKNWNSEAAKTYGVQGVPNNFLLDRDGRVIATNLRGRELKAVLAQMLK
jgi:peroxiredoxin